jgi:cytochrome c peroxidase
MYGRHARRLVALLIAGCAATALLAKIAPSRADDATPAAVTTADAAAGHPWDERAIKSHIDESTISGTLSQDALNKLIAEGRALFTAKFTIEDGSGRPLATQAIIPTHRKHPVDIAFRRTAGMDANSCSSCHDEPAVGGGGPFTVNVFVSEGFESVDFDSLDPQFSNERNTNALFGDGLVELLAREMTADLRAIRSKAATDARVSGQAITAELVTKGVDFGKVTVAADGTVDNSGVQGIDADLTVRPFSQKGVFTSLRQFTINALNAHHGMEATERFGARWTGTRDFDGDGHPDEFSPGDVSALVAFQASLAPPVQMTPADADWKAAAAHGHDLFKSMGCSSCHVEALPLKSLSFADPAPYDLAGTLRTGEVPTSAAYDLSLLPWVKTLSRDDQGNYLVPLFGDLKRHKIADNEVTTLGNELLAQRFVERDIFITAELWGVASTAPYGHRGDLTTLDEVIRAHGGEAKNARLAYVAATEEDRSSLIAFLKTLVIPQ